MKLIAKLSAPYSIRIPRKTKKDKQFTLNLNNYRNTHYHVLNQAKVIYKDLMQAQIGSLPVLAKVAVRYTIFPRTRQRVDIHNICSIQEKFFMDAVVEFGKLPDDDYTHYIETGYKFGCVDKQNPRVEIEIYDAS
jgi:hypothetical protein